VGLRQTHEEVLTQHFIDFWCIRSFQSSHSADFQTFSVILNTNLLEKNKEDKEKKEEYNSNKNY